MSEKRQFRVIPGVDGGVVIVANRHATRWLSELLAAAPQARDAVLRAFLDELAHPTTIAPVKRRPAPDDPSGRLGAGDKKP
jgi:hypothetical protein